MRVLCARHPHLGLAAVLRRFPELRGEPVIVAGGDLDPGAPRIRGGRVRDPSGGELRLPVIAASDPARVAGVRPGQPLRQAQHLCPMAALVPLDAVGVERLRGVVGAELEQFSPAVEAGDEESFADLSGSHAGFIDEAAWASVLARSLRCLFDTELAVGVGGSRFVARVAARSSRSGRIRRVRAGDEAALLAPLPLEVLPVDPRITARLAAFGLDCVGAVAGLSPADLQRQFGPEGIRLHRLARGEDDAGVLPAAGRRTWSERLVFDGPAGDLETLLRAVRHCAEALGERLAGDGLAAGEVGVVYELEDAASLTASVTPAAPMGNPGETWIAALGLLGGLRPAAPVAAVRVGVTRLAPAVGRQADLLRPGDGTREGVAAAAGRLRLRFGDAAVLRPRLALDPGDLPERRFVWDAPAAVAAGASSR